MAILGGAMPRSDSQTMARRRFIGGVGLAALGLAACGSESSPAADAAPTSQGVRGTGAPDAVPATTTASGAAPGDSCPPGARLPGGDTAPTGAHPTPTGLGDPMPAPAAPVEPSSFLWTAARVLTVSVPLDPEGFGEWLPPGLRLADEPRATCFVAHYPHTTFGSVYNEAAVLVDVVDAEGEARHCPWMVVDDDTALVLGREMLGFPKKLAQITLVEDGDAIVGTVRRRGVEVLRLEADRSGLRAEEGRVWPRLVNVFGSVIGGMRLLVVPPQPEEVHERAVGTGTVITAPAERDPLASWLVAGDGEAAFAVLDFATLQAGGALGAEVPLDWALSHTITRAT